MYSVSGFDFARCAQNFRLFKSSEKADMKDAKRYKMMLNSSVVCLARKKKLKCRLKRIFDYKKEE
ncbi:hypothetical protein Bca4012_026096 [Brassica carinata]